MWNIIFLCILLFEIFPFARTALLYCFFLFWAGIFIVITIICNLPIFAIIDWAYLNSDWVFNQDIHHTTCPSNTTTAILQREADDAARISTAEWLDSQRAIIDFRFFSPSSSDRGPDLQTRLELRAQANSRLVRAFGVDNSLTTSFISTHKQFHARAARLISEASRDPGRWTRLYGLAKGVLKRDVMDARAVKKPLSLADCARRMCLVVVLVDNFGEEGLVHGTGSVLGKIAARVNDAWVRSKCDDGGERDEILEGMIKGLGLREDKGRGNVLEVEEVLGIIMPQYETLWRVVLLTFVTAFHRQVRKENLDRAETVPGCLGGGEKETEALKLAMVSHPFSVACLGGD